MVQYLNKLLADVGFAKIPEYLCNDPFSDPTAYLNLPALLITVIVTVILVIGIRESATTNAFLVAVKVGVVLFVIFAGIAFINKDNWTKIPTTDRIFAADIEIPALVAADVKEGTLKRQEAEERIRLLVSQIDKVYADAAVPTAQRKARQEELVMAFYEETGKLRNAKPTGAHGL